MSSYVDFYVVNEKKKQHLLLNSFSRSNPIYSSLNEVCGYRNYKPYKLTHEMVLEILEDLDNSINVYNKLIAKNEKALEILKNSNDSIENKYEFIWSILSDNDETKEEIKSIEKARHWFEAIEGIVCSEWNNQIYVTFDGDINEIWGEKSEN